MTGTGHGCIVQGPQGRYWVFYTVFACVVHGFERRVGLDLVDFDENGGLFGAPATSTPQPLPRNGPEPAEPAWLPLNESEPTLGSSSATNTSGRSAADNSMTTWWLPAADDATPTPALRARLVIVGHPPGIQPAVAEFTVFGVTER